MRWPWFSRSWIVADDRFSKRCSRLAGDGPHGHEKGFPALALLVQETLKRDPHDGQFSTFSVDAAAIFSRSSGMTARAPACSRSGWSAGVSLAFDGGWRGDDFSGAIVLSARGIDWRMPQKTWRPKAAG